jgi:hypothetical protein
MADASLTRGSVSQCPECDEIIGADDGCACAVCGRLFHMDCLDADTLTCLDCVYDADSYDRHRGFDSSYDDEDE